MERVIYNGLLDIVSPVSGIAVPCWHWVSKMHSTSSNRNKIEGLFVDNGVLGYLAGLVENYFSEGPSGVRRIRAPKNKSS